MVDIFDNKTSLLSATEKFGSYFAPSLRANAFGVGVRVQG